MLQIVINHQWEKKFIYSFKFVFDENHLIGCFWCIYHGFRTRFYHRKRFSIWECPNFTFLRQIVTFITKRVEKLITIWNFPHNPFCNNVANCNKTSMGEKNIFIHSFKFVFGENHLIGCFWCIMNVLQNGLKSVLQFEIFCTTRLVIMLQIVINHKWEKKYFHSFIQGLFDENHLIGCFWCIHDVFSEMVSWVSFYHS